MSKPTITKITCPTCKHTFNATLWMSVTSTLDPQLKTRVLDGTLFDHSCPKCHQPLRMEHDFIYSDPVRKFMLTMKLPKDGEPPTVSTGLLDGMAGLLQGARLRIVTSFKQLREKILIFDADLSDELIELLKLVVWQQTFGTADVSDDSVFFVQKRTRLLRASELVFELYRGPQRLGEASVPWSLYKETIAEAERSGCANPEVGEWKLVNQSALRADPPSTLPDRLTKQVLGGQSVLFRLFREALRCDEQAIRKIELTYFALSVVSHFCRKIGCRPDYQASLVSAADQIWARSIDSSGEKITPANALAEYRERVREYHPLLGGIFPSEQFATEDLNIHTCTTLFLHLYECVMRSSAQNAMLSIATATPLLGSYLLDHVDFVTSCDNDA